MKEYMVCEYAPAYGVELSKAREFTEEEKSHYTDDFKDKGFISLGRSTKLEELMWNDVLEVLQNREHDGSFPGCNNYVYIINQKEWQELTDKNNCKKAVREEEKRKELIKKYKEIIQNCESQKLYTNEEAAKKRTQYNNLMNEGGEGYVPHYYTINEYEEAKKQLEKLNQP